MLRKSQQAASHRSSVEKRVKPLGGIGTIDYGTPLNSSPPQNLFLQLTLNSKQ
jgi:hypothetical protein